ncbi:Peroxisomal N(1)-acetyl-spermine/spermidine oxidase [Halotydeus destructor]|nr:Peroxisomal N(1)-acetyl-spermine/spermidine oxidase [Halotydeus destructor]
MTKEFDVIIIGAGIAGLSTAYHLSLNEQFNGSIAILEANDRLGGRIHGIESTSGHIELGANWIHGMHEHNELFRFALKNGLVDIDDIPNQPSFTYGESANYHVTAVTHDGKPVPNCLLKQVREQFGVFVDECQEMFYSHDVQNEELIQQYEDSMGKYLESRIEDYLESKSEDGTNVLRRAIFSNLLEQENNHTSSHTLEDTSLKYIGSFIELPGGNATIIGGSYELIKTLISQTESNLRKKLTILPNLDIYLEHEVSKVDWSENGAVRVTCSNGSNFTCNQLVCSVSLGVLKDRARTMFRPSLPNEKLNCIERLGFGSVNKILLEFDEDIVPNFWPSGTNELIILWSDEGNSNQIKPLFFKNCAKTKWWQTIPSFVLHSNRCLLGWITGHEAELVEHLNAVDLGDSIVTNILRTAVCENFPMPVNTMTTKWKSDKFCQGSYSFIAAKGDVKDMEVLAKPLYSDNNQSKPSVIFAGEACHPVYYSTAQGAFESGQRAAQDLIAGKGAFKREALTTLD